MTSWLSFIVQTLPSPPGCREDLQRAGPSPTPFSRTRGMLLRDEVTIALSATTPMSSAVSLQCRFKYVSFPCLLLHYQNYSAKKVNKSFRLIIFGVILFQPLQRKHRILAACRNGHLKLQHVCGVRLLRPGEPRASSRAMALLDKDRHEQDIQHRHP